MEYYFTNLDFPEIRRFLLRNHHLAAQNSCEVAITWPDIYNYIYTQMYIQQKHNSSSKSINGLLEELRLINYRDHLCLQHDVVDVEYPNLLVLFFGINLQDDDNCPWSTQKEATRSTQLWLLDSKLPQTPGQVVQMYALCFCHDLMIFIGSCPNATTVEVHRGPLLT